MLKFIQSIILLLIVIGVNAQPFSGPPSCRDLHQWPYAQNSIWNTPIGTGAQYHPQPVSPSHIDGIQADNDIIVLKPNAPLMNVFGTKWRWQGGTTPETRCQKYNNTVLLKLPIPSDYVTLFYKQEKPNNAGIVMQPDGKTLVQIQPFQACGGGYATSGLRKSGGNIINDLIRTPDLDIKGDGRTGMHGGSGLNTMGGAIRLGELTSPYVDAMRHALKISFPGDQYLYFDHSKNKGYRWPAWKHDTGADRDYNSSNKEATIGCLRALKPDLDINSLGLETLPGKKLAWTLQNYGAYQVEGVPWQRMMIAVEEGPDGAVVTEFLDHYGWEFVSKNKTGNPWVKDCLKIIQHLYIVKNNTQSTRGGGGTPLQPLAPPFCDGANPDPNPDPEPDPDPVSTVKVNFQPPSTSVPSGYLADNGAAYGSRGNGQSYGWVGGSNTATRLRSGSNDQRLKTLNHLQDEGNKTWEIALANGEYDVKLVCGDAQYSDQINNIDLEGNQLTDQDGESNFDIFNERVTVADGKLTIKPGTGASNAKVCYIDIAFVENDDPDPMMYTLTVSNGIGDGTYTAGTSVNITADMAPTGKVFSSWTGDVAGIANVNSESTTITMPSADVTIAATYEDISIPEFALVVIGGSGDGNYTEGTSINITADEAPSGQVFDQWTGDVSNLADPSSATTTVTMPAANISLSATYKNQTPPSGGSDYAKINFQPTGASTPSGYLVDNGGAYGSRGNGFTYGWLGGDNTATRVRSANSDARLNTLNHLAKNGNKTWEIAIPNGEYTLEIACGDAQYSDQINNISVEGNVLNDPDGEDNFDVFSTMVTVSDGKLSISPASGALNPKICYIDIASLGGDVTPTTYMLTVNNGSGSGEYEEGEVISIVADDAPIGQEFDQWTGDVSGVQDINNVSTSVTIATTDVILSATYKALPPTTYNLTVNNGSGSGNYVEGMVVDVMADAPSSGQEFLMWTGDIIGLTDVNSASTSFTVATSDASITATYQDIVIPTFTLAVNGGSGSGDYEAGTSVNISANAAPNGQVFDMWTGDIAALTDPSAASTSLTMPSSAVSVSATYKDEDVQTITPLVNVNFQPLGSSTPSDYVSDAGAAYGNRGNGFSYGWLGGDNGKTRQRSGSATQKLRTLNHLNNGGNRTWEIGVSNGTYQVTIACGDAQYSDQVNTIDIEGVVLTDPDGEDNFDVFENILVDVTDGRLTIKPASGASNPKICYIDINSFSGDGAPMTYSLTVNNGSGDGSYTAGMNVSISADAAPSGQMFDQWTGDIAGIADVNAASTSLQMPAANASVTATYKAIPPTMFVLTVTNGSGSGNYTAGTVVNITADAAPTGQMFDQWTGNTSGIANTSSASTTITMPSADASISATYKDQPSGGDCEDLSISIEAEDGSNTLNGNAKVANKSSASGGRIVGSLGNGSNNYLIVNNISVPCSDTYSLEVQYISGENRTIFISVNNGSAVSETVNSGGWNQTDSFTKSISLNQGSNTIKFFNNSGKSPDIDKITIVYGEPAPPVDPPSPPATGHPFVAKRKVIVETDFGGDRDDQSSLIRWLLYTNEWDVQGIIFDRANNRFQKDGAASNPTGANSTMDMASDYLDAYGDVRSKLIQHDPDYPTRSYLWSKSVHGHNGSNAGVNLIINAVDNATEDNPIWYHNWGSNSGTTSNLKRAFDKIKNDRSSSAYNAFVRKVKIVTLDGKDDTKQQHEDKVTLHVETGYKQLGGGSETRWYRRFDNITAGFISESSDIKNNHGNLGKLYVGQKEGDSWTFIYMIPTGMNEPYEPTWGSWAGRYGVRDGGNKVPNKKPFYWANQEDNWNGSTNRDNTAARFARALQNDFKARLDWCVKGFGSANHEPNVVVQGDNSQAVLYLNAQAGSSVSLSAAGTTDPDGNNLSYSWWQYKEADNYSGSVSISGASSPNASVSIPSNASGKTIHIICEVEDNGSPRLTRYRRVVINVQSSGRFGTTTQPQSFISLYPNPADGSQAITLSFSNMEGDKMIRVLDNLGRVMKEVETSASKMEITSAEHWSSGIYIVSVQHNGKVFTRKIRIE